MTDPGRLDISRPASLAGAFEALTPAGTDTGALMDALKASRREDIAWCQDCQRPHPSWAICPERQDRLAKAAENEPLSPERLAALRESARAGSATVCAADQPGEHGTGCTCGFRLIGDSWLTDGQRASLKSAAAEVAQSLAFPADPFTPGRLAAAATKDWYDDLLEAGMPLASVERILGAMLAAAAHFAADEA